MLLLRLYVQTLRSLLKFNCVGFSIQALEHPM